MRLMIRLGFVFALCLFVAALALAHPHSHSTGTREELSWAIIDDDHGHTSNLDEMEEIEDLKTRFGENFLYIRDRDERYVITNRAMIERAEDASHRIVEPAKALAKAASRLALSQVKTAKAQVKLESAESRLEAAIEGQETRGEETDELRRALEQVREELGDLEATGDRRHLTPAEQKELERRRDEAHERLEKAVSEMRSEVRDILRDAKEKGLAERVR